MLGVAVAGGAIGLADEAEDDGLEDVLGVGRRAEEDAEGSFEEPGQGIEIGAEARDEERVERQEAAVVEEIKGAGFKVLAAVGHAAEIFHRDGERGDDAGRVAQTSRVRHRDLAFGKEAGEDHAGDEDMQGHDGIEPIKVMIRLGRCDVANAHIDRRGRRTRPESQKRRHEGEAWEESQASIERFEEQPIKEQRRHEPRGRVPVEQSGQAAQRARSPDHFGPPGL
mmetsp:Transcript_10692/g.27216  ORF Transcript_10692/g.27216 Transcript_10692/m.27216 type:complete len:225 (-) Transcript_10692:466-1140(-)